MKNGQENRSQCAIEGLGFRLRLDYLRLFQRFGGPHNKDNSTLGSILGPPI